MGSSWLVPVRLPAIIVIIAVVLMNSIKLASNAHTTVQLNYGQTMASSVVGEPETWQSANNGANQDEDDNEDELDDNDFRVGSLVGDVHNISHNHDQHNGNGSSNSNNHHHEVAAKTTTRLTDDNQAPPSDDKQAEVNNKPAAAPASASKSKDEPQVNSDAVPPWMQHMTHILVILHCSVFITGLVGNALVCLSVYRNKSLQTVTNYYIVNLAVADFLVILICLPPTVYWDLTLTWNFGLILCKLVPYLQVSTNNNCLLI